MLRVSDIMTTEVITLEPEISLKEAASLLSDGGITGAPVVAVSEVVGVLSTTDILTFGSASPGTPVGEGGTERGEWKEPDDRIPPEEDPAGYFVDFWENAGADVVERFSETGAPEWDVLAEHTVSEVMSRTLFAVGPDEEVQEAARRMIERGIHRLLVTDGEGHLKGIVSAVDVVRAVAEGRL